MSSHPLGCLAWHRSSASLATSDLLIGFLYGDRHPVIGTGSSIGTQTADAPDTPLALLGNKSMELSCSPRVRSVTSVKVTGSISTSVMSAAKAAVEKAAARVAIASSDFMISPQGERRGNCVPSYLAHLHHASPA